MNDRAGGQEVSAAKRVDPQRHDKGEERVMGGIAGRWISESPGEEYLPRRAC